MRIPGQTSCPAACASMSAWRALAINPDILLMDEEFSAFNPLIRAEMQDELIKLQSRHQRTIIFISHDLDEAMHIGDRIAIMQGGEVVQVGMPDEILNNPANDYPHLFPRRGYLAGIQRQRYLPSPAGNPDPSKTTSVGPRSALRLLQDKDRDFDYVLERGQKFIGVVSIHSLKAALSTNGTLEDALLSSPATIPRRETPLSELISTGAQAPCALSIVGENNQYIGIISKGMLLQSLDERGNE